eukprot:5385393-Amphidinium_carterae.1
MDSALPSRPSDITTVDRPDSMETFRMYQSCLASGAKLLSSNSSSAAYRSANESCFTAARTIS